MVAGWATNSLTARELSRPPEVLGVAPSGLADAAFVRSLYLISGPAGQTLSFTIRSLDPATSYSATGLPNGLSLNSALGVIGGALPASPGSHEVTLRQPTNTAPDPPSPSASSLSKPLATNP